MTVDRSPDLAGPAYEPVHHGIVILDIEGFGRPDLTDPVLTPGTTSRTLPAALGVE